MLSTANWSPRTQFSTSNSSSFGSITPSYIQDFDFRSILLFLNFSISQELYLSDRARRAKQKYIDFLNL